MTTTQRGEDGGEGVTRTKTRAGGEDGQADGRLMLITMTMAIATTTKMVAAKDRD